MLDIQYHIIVQLKQQPRHGMAKKTTKPTLADTSLTDANNVATSAIEALVSAENRAILGAGALITQLQDLAKGFQAVAKESLWLEDRNKDLSDTFGMNITQATRLGGVLDANATKFGVGGQTLRKYTQNLQGLIGGFATVNNLIETGPGAALYKTQKFLQANMKLTGEQANSYELYASGIGKSSEETLLAQNAIAQSIEKATGRTGVFKEILDDVAGLTADVQIQYGKIPGQLELGILKAKALGFSMKELTATGENLLNIESSIGQELEYQLLSGRRLTDQSGKSLTNAYREATLQGNATKQADTLNTILEQEGDTLKNNLFARKQMSDLLGIDEASLARALQKKSILERLPGGEALFDLTGDAMLSAAKASGATAKDLEELNANMDNRTTDQRMLEDLDIMTSEGISVMIKNPADLQQKNASNILDTSKKLTKTIPEVVTPEAADIAGGVKQAAQMATAVADIAAYVKKIALGTIEVNPNLDKTEKGVIVTATGLATGGVIPPGYPNDTFPAMLTSGETVTPAGGSVTPAGGSNADVAQLAAAIVAAINNQTKALTSNGFGDYYA